MGFNSDLRLMYQDAVALIAFDNPPRLPEGSEIVQTQITVHAWSDGPGENQVSLDLAHAPADWREGTGNWYFFDGAGRNNYAQIYADFPDYVPPVGSSNPSQETGITWNTSASLRHSLAYAGSAKAVLPSPTADGKYPLLGKTETLTFEITGLLRKPEDLRGPLSLGLMQSIPSRGTNAGGTWFYSRNHAQPETYAPTLALTYR